MSKSGERLIRAAEEALGSVRDLSPDELEAALVAAKRRVRPPTGKELDWAKRMAKELGLK